MKIGWCPSISVIVVNYNGARFLRTCLASLRAQRYPPDRFEVILVDNGSSDESVDLVEREFPEVRLVRSHQNVGFAGGCNLGESIATGDFIALLNNDAEADPLWLRELVAPLRDSTVAATTSRVRFYYDYVEAYLRSKAPASVVKTTVKGLEFEAPLFRHRLDSQTYRLEVPVRRKGQEVALTVTLRAPQPMQVRLQVGAQSQKAYLDRGGSRDVDFVIPIGTAEIYPVIQNAGLLILPGGKGRDRGTWISSEGTAHYLRDSGQWDRVEEVFGACGVAALFRREIIQELGFFDPWYFAYYEDLDLSWRMRLQGWKILYVPGARVRHVHCGTSKEWSSSFRYYTERNRLATVLRNGWCRLVVEAWAESLSSVISMSSTSSVKLQAWKDLLRHVPSLLHSRSRTRAAERRRGDAEVVEWMEKGLRECEAAAQRG